MDKTYVTVYTHANTIDECVDKIINSLKVGE